MQRLSFFILFIVAIVSMALLAGLTPERLLNPTYAGRFAVSLSSSPPPALSPIIGLKAVDKSNPKQRKNEYYYDCKERFDSPPEDPSSEWSIDRWQREYCQRLENETWPKADLQLDQNILFVDGREECEKYREFLINVRKSNFLGHIVLMVYYPEDRDRCGRLAADLSVEIFYYPSPRWEWTLFQYHGVVNYFYQNPNAVSKYQMAAVVRPDRLTWCSNPFSDVPVPTDALNRTLYAIWHGDPRWVTVKAHLHNSSAGLSVVADHVLLSTTFGLKSFMEMVLTEAVTHVRITADPSWSYIQSSAELRAYRDEYIRPFPNPKYRVGSCKDPVCPEGEKGLQLRSFDCYYPKADGEPTYNPFCNFEYRHSVLEVPKDTTLTGYATDEVMKGAHKIRDAPLMRNVTEDQLNNVFANPSAKEIDPAWGGVGSQQCPNGKLAIVSMMGGYSMNKVQDFIGSFIHFADPHCTKLVLMLKGKKGIHKSAEMYPDRVEIVDFEDGEPFEPVIYKHRGVMDRRYEVAMFWLEQHYKEYRYVMATDTRDYFFFGDPLKALVRLLDNSGYLGKEFVGSVSESFALGSFSGYVNDFINQCAIDWLEPCGTCYRALTKMTYTNGDSFATVNTGNVVGTAVGLLHYYRFHIRMTVESNYGFDKVRGTDQGLFTFYVHGMLQEANYPHKVLIFPSSRAGFTANPMPYNRIARRPRKDGTGWEYAVKDCGGNYLASIHQSDRDNEVDKLLRTQQGLSAPWRKLMDSGEFESYFQINS